MTSARTIISILVALHALAFCLLPCKYSPSPIALWPAFAPNPQGLVIPLTRKNVRRIAEGKIRGPESVLFSPSTGGMFSLTEHGTLVYIDEKTDDVHTAAVLSGRPLGGSFSVSESTPTTDVLYVADALKGLLRVSIPTKQPSPPSSATVTLVSARVDVPCRPGGGTEILYSDDVSVASKSGLVYFSDASDVGLERVAGDPSKWDTLGASIVDGLRGKRSGSLLVYDPKTRSTKCLADDLWFANGVSVSTDESQVLIAETFLSRVHSYSISTGILSPVVPSSSSSSSSVTPPPFFTGYVDGLSQSPSLPSVVHVAIPSPSPAAIRLLSHLPDWLHTAVRSLALRLPPLVKPEPYGCFVELDYVDGKVRKTYVDEKGEALGMVTSVVERDGKLYLGSLKNDYIGVVDMVA